MTKDQAPVVNRRYVVQAIGWPENKPGWQDVAFTDDPDAAQRLKHPFTRHPSVRKVRIFDRQAKEGPK